MQNTTTLDQPKVNIISHYHKQYLKNHIGLNMEFTEFMANKLRVSEADAVKVIRNWKNTTITLTKNK